MNPPKCAGRGGCIRDKERSQIGGHQGKNEECYESGFVGGLLAEPPGAHQKAANEEAHDAGCAGQGECGSKIKIETAKPAFGREKADSQSHSKVVESDQGEGTEPPEDEGVRQAGQRALSNDLSLADHLPDEVPDAAADGEQVEVRVFLRAEDLVENRAESPPEGGAGRKCETNEKKLLQEREVLWFGKDCVQKSHKRTKSRYTIELGAVVGAGFECGIC